MDLGSEVIYKCAPGNFFRHNKTQIDFTVKCDQDGNFERPRTWPICQSEVTQFWNFWSFWKFLKDLVIVAFQLNILPIIWRVFWNWISTSAGDMANLVFKIWQPWNKKRGFIGLMVLMLNLGKTLIFRAAIFNFASVLYQWFIFGNPGKNISYTFHIWST